jgi:hypothetical protein
MPNKKKSTTVTTAEIYGDKNKGNEAPIRVEIACIAHMQIVDIRKRANTFILAAKIAVTMKVWKLVVVYPIAEL